MIKTLLGQVGEYKKDSILTPVFTAAEVFMEILIPFVTAKIIDEGINGQDMSKVYMYGGLMLVLAFLSLFFGVMAGKFAASASTGFACNLREGMYRNVQEFSFTNIDKFSTASLITRMTTDVTNVQNAYQMLIRIAVRAPLMLICSMIMCFTINVELSLVFVAALVVLAFGLFFIIFKVTPIFDEVFRNYDNLNASVQENVSAIRVVKAFVREEYEDKKFGKAAEVLAELSIKAESLLAFNNPIMMFVIFTCMMLLSWIGAHFIVSGSMTTGNLTSLFSYVMSMMMSLMMLSMVFVMISMSMASMRRISEVLEETPTMTNPDEPIMEVPDGRIDFRELVKDLASVFRTRIELRQIGVRDEVKRIGGNGVCGRELCCCTFLNNFETVSIKMAKEQNIALNPSKISGNCGRLMCCLKYEQDVYSEKLSRLPKVGAIVKTEAGEGTVEGVEVLKEVLKVKIKDGDDYKLFTGNQTGALLVNFVLTMKKDTLNEKSTLVKTIVTSELGANIGRKFGLKIEETLTGFKYIGDKINKYEESGKQEFVIGYEESYGYMLGDYVRDKDAVTASMLLTEMAAWYDAQGMTLFDALNALYEKYGWYAEKTHNLVMPGLDGLRDMAKLMKNLRENPPAEVSGVKVIVRKDYTDGSVIDCVTGAKSRMELSGSNVLRYELEDGTVILVRPSGTEPKIKVYILTQGADAAASNANLEKYGRWVAALKP